MINGTVAFAIVDASYNFTDLMPNTAYDVTFASRLTSTCSGIHSTTMVTTLAVEAGVPQSKLIIVNMYVQFEISVVMCVIRTLILQHF